MKNTILKWGFLIFVFWVALPAAQAQNYAQNIINRYYDTRRDCGGYSSPAFLCTGVFIRGTEYSPSYHSWDPSPTSVADGGVSFSYLRADSKFNKLAYGYKNGIIFYPTIGAPTGKLALNYLCAFPMDGATNNRSDNGCGPTPGGPYSSQCQNLNVTTGYTWVKALDAGTFVERDNGFYACGFSVANADNPVGGTANGFFAMLDAMFRLGSRSFNEQNEIRVKTWAQGLGKTLPIEAFFYLNGGLASAQADQVDLYKTDGVWVPVIQMILPSNMNLNALFYYNDGDQAIRK